MDRHSTPVTGSRARRLRAGVVLLALVAGSTTAASLLVARGAGALRSGRGSLPWEAAAQGDLDALLSGGAAALLLLGLVLASLSTAGSVVLGLAERALPGRGRDSRLEAVIAPAVVRRMVGTALGVGVLAGAGAPAASALPPAPVSALLVPSWPPLGDGFADAPTQAVPAPRVDTPRPAPPAPPADASAPGPGEPPADVVVQRGDTLWDIAAEHSPGDASSASIAERWPRWWSANRAVIGDDPDLITPGQHLVAPTGQRS